MKIKTSELTGKALDFAVLKCERPDWVSNSKQPEIYVTGCGFTPSTSWSDAGPIIQREKITIVCAEGEYNDEKAGTPDCYDTYWIATIGRLCAETAYGSQGDNWGESFQIDSQSMSGPTPLIAALRCYVASNLGKEVDIPDVLL